MSHGFNHAQGSSQKPTRGKVKKYEATVTDVLFALISWLPRLLLSLLRRAYYLSSYTELTLMSCLRVVKQRLGRPQHDPPT